MLFPCRLQPTFAMVGSNYCCLLMRHYLVVGFLSVLAAVLTVFSFFHYVILCVDSSLIVSKCTFNFVVFFNSFSLLKK